MESISDESVDAYSMSLGLKICNRRLALNEAYRILRPGGKPHAPHMLFQDAFSLFGWVLITTTLCLFVLPWRWHHRFAQQMVPRATRYITLIGLSSLVLGGLFLAAAYPVASPIAFSL